MTKLHTETYGNGKPIVMVHGWAMHSGIWRGFAQELAKNYRVTLVDLPGHGHSQPVFPFDLETISQALVKAIADGPCCWLGWSLGAEIVIEIANRFPGQVSRLIILAGTPCFVRNGSWPGIQVEVLESFSESLGQDSRAALLRFLSLQLKGESDYKKALQGLKQSIFEYPAPDHRTLQEGLRILKETDLRQEIAGLNLPFGAILGELDTLVPVAVGGNMASLLPQIDIRVIPRVGHVPFLSHQKAVVDAVRTFMEK